jgi:hypothetical protein
LGKIDHWALAPGKDSKVVIAAWSREYVLWSMGGTDHQWKVLKHLEEQSEQARFVVVGENKYWAEWVTKDRGFCYAPLVL